MTTALFAVPGILAPLQGLFRWFAGSTLASRSGLRPATLQIREKAGPITKVHAAQARPSSPIRPQRPVLRIMRVLEAGQAPASVGRMVISGRMADVCAELDRLAAREAALH
jgi:hypothetical protein